MSDHGFTGNVLIRFHLIVKWVAQVYFHMWYEIKVKHKIVEGLEHIVKLLRMLRQQEDEIK